MLTAFRKLFSYVLSCLPPDSRTRLDLITRVLWELPDVVYFRLRDRGFGPNGIIDIGAHVGEWTRSIKNVFPSAPIIMIEARELQREALEQVCAELQNVSYVIALLGREQRDSVEFHVLDTGSSLFNERSNVPRSSAVLPVLTLDELASTDCRLKSPLFLKLDVQGAELEVLRGAASTLSTAEVVQLEVQILHYNEGAPSAADVIAFMNEHDFAIFDVAGFIRPNGVGLVQLDLIFVRKNSSLRPDFFRYLVGETA